MSRFYDRAVELRAIETPHYNCAQAVVLPFAKEAGLSEQAAYQVAANFGAGMKRAATCGSIAGGLMVLGLFGVDDPQTIGSYYQSLKKNHENHLDCANLLKISREQGREKKPHCDGMVYECVTLVENILKEKGKIQ
ncbi:MAG: C-GCAxxG-C-C family protein [Lachnospiraceae bacterium]|nr:C-GCAxxG-C-C family protein [Lachnospiraceae bacterium]